MQKLFCLLCLVCLLAFGCVAGSLQINPDDFKSLQSTGNGEPTVGCATANVSGSSGVIGGSSRVIVIWGELDTSITDWCIGR